MSTTKNKSVSFYFGSDVPIVAEKPTNEASCMSYIILQNDTLHTIVKELQKTIHNLKTEKQDLEDTVETLESTKISINEFIRHEVEYISLQNKLCDEYENILSNYMINSKNTFQFLFTISLLQIPFVLYPLSVMHLLTLSLIYAYMGYTVYQNYFIKIHKKEKLKEIMKIVEIAKNKHNTLLPDPLDSF